MSGGAPFYVNCRDNVADKPKYHGIANSFLMSLFLQRDFCMKRPNKAKSLVLHPRYRPRVVKDAKRYNRKTRRVKGDETN